MKKILKGLFFVAIVAFIFILGEVVPRVALSYYNQENTDKSEKSFVQYSMREAKRVIAEEKDENILTGIKMGKLVEEPGQPGDPICMDYPILLRGQYEAQIELYTIFGVPYGKVTVNCKGTTFVKYFDK